MKLHWQILIALALGIVVGSLTGIDAHVMGVTFHDVFAFIGTLFLNALKMLIVPLVIASIITGVAGIGSSSSLGRLGSRTLIYYLGTSLIAILIGLAVVNLVAPGQVDGAPAQAVLGLQQEVAGDLSARLQERNMGDVAEVFLRMVPPNVFAAAVEGQMLGLILFGVLFGFFMTRLEGVPRQSVHGFWQGVFQVMMHMTDLVMRFAPLGVFALVAKVVAETGFGAVGPMLLFFVTVVVALAVHVLIVLPVILYLAGVDPLRHYRAILPALLTAFSTSSSSATLPISMECVEKNAGVSNRTTSFVLPLGATINMDGTALYECVAVMFIAQAYGLELTFATQFTVVALALLTSIGVAGIPAASLVAIVVIMGAVGLPLEGIGLLLATDRLLDMARTAVNVAGDTCGAVVLARMEGETTSVARGTRTVTQPAV